MLTFFVCFSLLTKSIILEFKEEVAAWSCAWNMQDSRFYYVGLGNGKVGIYDTRKTSGRVGTLEFSKCPVIHLVHMEQRASHKFPLGGLVASSLMHCSFFHQLDNDMLAYAKYNIVDSGSLISTSFDRSTRLVTVSVRPER